jgi:hypothetical protein
MMTSVQGRFGKRSSLSMESRSGGTADGQHADAASPFSLFDFLLSIFAVLPA